MSALPARKARTKPVATSSLAVDSDGEVVVIGTDSSTRVVGKGGPRDLLYRKGRPKLSDVIKAGDRVIVTCRTVDRTPYAVEIRVSKK